MVVFVTKVNNLALVMMGNDSNSYQYMANHRN